MDAASAPHLPMSHDSPLGTAPQPSLRLRTARLSISVVAALAVFKAAAFAATGSSGVLGSALDSALDLMTSLMVLIAIVHAERPADADHPWGHGKAEGLASLAQSVLILGSGLGLIYHTISRFLGDETQLNLPWLGICVMAVSSVVSFWLARRVKKAATETRSPALDSDSQHHAADVLVNVAAIGGIVLSTLLNGAVWPDLMVGVMIGLFILNTARVVFLEAIENLMDRGLDSTEAAAIVRATHAFAPKVAGFHDLRTRRSGADLFVELHLDIHRELSFVEAHDLSEEVGEAIETSLPNCRVTVHADPL